MEKTLILGMGNSIISDDKVGLIVAKKIYEKLNNKNVDLKLVEIGGMDLLEKISGYKNLIVIDSIKTGKLKYGEVVEIDFKKEGSHRILSSHDISFFEMLNIGKLTGYNIPENIKVFGIEIKDNTTFSESLTIEIKKKLPSIVEEILDYININFLS